MLKPRDFVLAVMVVTVSQIASAQKPITQSTTVKTSGTIVSIDSSTRTVVLRTSNGEEDAYVMGPEVKRFNELKVGDKVNASYVESIVVTVQPPGAAAKPSTASAAVTAGTGKTPGATLATQLTATVTVKAINPAAPAVTVTTADGRTVTRKIENKKNLEGIKIGDKLDLTYTQAVLLSVEHAK
jgi:hypothetical protein